MLNVIVLLSAGLLISCTHTPTTTPVADNDDRAVNSAASVPTNALRTPAAKREGITPENQADLALKCQLPARLANMPKEVFVKHKAYWVNYNPQKRAPNWIYHELYKENMERACFKRPGPGSGPFTWDFDLRNVVIGFDAANDLSILDGDSFKGTGFDRGHLAPNADFAFDNKAQIESFYMTNMMAQEPDVNQQTWEKLERRVREMACTMGHVRVYTGPIYPKDTPTHVLQSCAAIPEAYYKALLTIKDGKYHGIAFIYSQNDRVGRNLDGAAGKGDISDQRVASIAEVEARTGIPLFTEFAEEIQREFKNQKDLSAWSPKPGQVSCYKTKCSNRAMNNNANVPPPTDVNGSVISAPAPVGTED